MRTTLHIVAWIVLASLCFPAGSALAQGKDAPAQEGKGPKSEKSEKKAKKKKDQAPKKEKTAAEGQAAPGQDPAALAAMMKAISPGENHKALEPLAGNWETAATFTMGPGLPAVQSKGKCKRHWVLGGRFLQEEVTGEMMGMPFEGLGLLGYDNLKQTYVSSWADTMGTAIQFSSGKRDASGKDLTLSGESQDPATGQVKKVRSTLHIDGKDKHTLAFFEPGPDGKEMKSMEIVFTRK